MAYNMKGFSGFKPSPAKVKKTPRLKAEKLPVYSKDSGLDTTKPGNKEKTDDYIVNSSKAYNKDNPRPNMENLPKGSVFVGGVSKKSPAKSDAAKNLLKAVPNAESYNKLSDEDKKGFDKAGKKAGLPTKNSPAKKRGLWDNIHAKRKRGGKMRKKGAKGAPTEKAIRDSQ